MLTFNLIFFKLDDEGDTLFKKILIANRGEVAARIIRSCNKLGIRPVPVYSSADAFLPYLKEVEESICIGPEKSTESYLNREAILQAAINTGCQAVHPGYGFLAEDHLFSYMCEQQKLTFIGPSPDSIRKMGDKSLAKKIFKDLGIESIPGSAGVIKSPEEAIITARETGFPVLLKASAGGGGKGIRICRNEKELNKFFNEAVREAEISFSSGELYMEKLIEDAKHIEFQILGDAYGNIIHLGERECSIQRKNQKLIEESPSPSIDKNTREKTGEKVVEALKKIGYQNAGTVEFLMDREKKLYFMEMNTRLQVEHPVSEMVTGTDLVEEQIKSALNIPLSLSQKDVSIKGHSIECRINAEDPENNFSPSPGKIEKFIPGLDGDNERIRMDTFIEEGYTVPGFYDSMIIKVISKADSRIQAIEKLIGVLKKIKLEGIHTTTPLLLKILNNKEFVSGNYNNRSLEKIMGEKSA